MHLVLRLWTLVVVLVAITLARSAQVDIPVRDPNGSLTWVRLGVLVGLTATVAVGHAVWTARGRALTVLRERWTGKRLALVAAGLLGYQVVYLCYRNLKSWDVLRAPRDEDLLRWDRWLFGGHDPATLLHDLLGQHHAAYVLMVVYMSFTAIVNLSLASALAVPARVRDTYAFLASMAFAWILGVGSYYLIPSLGPFASAPELFRGLPDLAVQETQAKYLAQRAQLLAHPEWGDSFAQISAFASLHTAVLAVIVLWAARAGLRRTAMALGAVLALTMVATIYWGWHFVLDDVAGLAIAVVAVAAGTRLMGAGGDGTTRGFSPGRSGAARLRKRATPESARRRR